VSHDYECPLCHDNGLPCFVCAGKGQLPTREEEERAEAQRDDAWEREREMRREGIYR
jgi:hypothetical protein